MANRKFLYVDANTEVAEEVSSVNTSAGAGDAGKLATLDAGGEWDATMLRLADNTVVNDLDGTNGVKFIEAMDLYNNGASQGAKILGGDPANIPQSSATTIQGILDDLAAVLDTVDGVDVPAGTGGVTKGDLVYVSANDTVLPLNPITGTDYAIGLAAADAAVGVDCPIVSGDYVLTGVLTTATAGTKYYWDGSALTTTAPAGSGSRVWYCGVALNATDLAVDVEYIKKNS